MDLSLRPAVPADAPAIIALTNYVFEEQTDPSYAADFLARVINDPRQLYLVAQTLSAIPTPDFTIPAGAIIGFSLATIIPTPFADMGTYAILNHICVHPSVRRGGIATKMLKETERICKQRGCSTLKLWSKNFRQPAHACYKRYGFEPINATFFEKTIKEDS